MVFRIIITICTVLALGSIPLLGIAVQRLRKCAQTREAILHAQIGALNNSKEQVIITDSAGVIKFVNAAFEAVTGYNTGEVIGKNFGLLYSCEEHSHDFSIGIWNTLTEGNSWNGQIWSNRRDGGRYTEEVTISPVIGSGKNIEFCVVAISSICVEEPAKAAVDDKAYYDPLTGLANRLLAGDRMKHAIAEAKRHENKLAVIFIDIDKFKDINDTLGHAAGDKVLEEVARRLGKPFREYDTVARIGGDEFVIILDHLNSVTDVEPMMNRLLTSICSPIKFKDHELTVTASIGISVYPIDGMDAETLIENADNAMYSVKRDGGNGYQVYQSGLQDCITPATQDEPACDFINQLVLHYQTRVHARTSQVTGLEALLRWEHPKHGLIYPACFLDYIENHSLYMQVTEMVLRRVCEHLCECQHSDIQVPTIAVNISSNTLKHGGLPKLVESVLTETGASPHYLELEFSEKSLVSFQEVAVSTLRKISNLGVMTAIDDFCTGNASIRFIQSLPLHAIRIDNSLISSINEKTDDARIIRAAVEVAHTFDLTVTAKGVEDLAQLQYLKGMGCDEIQGYFISRPVAWNETLTEIQSVPCLTGRSAA